MIHVEQFSKRFILHTQGGVELPVLHGVDLSVAAGECVVLDGPSGSGKSTLLRALYANYGASGGHIRLRHGDTEVDIVHAEPWTINAMRRHTIGYVSQFLRVIPRVPALDIVAEPLMAVGVEAETARNRARELLARLRIPERLWGLPPATFSGGEQQRVNVARGFIASYPILLLDEPTASLDADNRDTVVALIREARSRGAAIVGIFHDESVREQVADRLFPVRRVEQVA